MLPLPLSFNIKEANSKVSHIRLMYFAHVLRTHLSTFLEASCTDKQLSKWLGLRTFL